MVFVVNKDPFDVPIAVIVQFATISIIMFHSVILIRVVLVITIDTRFVRLIKLNIPTRIEIGVNVVNVKSIMDRLKVMLAMVRRVLISLRISGMLPGLSPRIVLDVDGWSN